MSDNHSIATARELTPREFADALRCGGQHAQAAYRALLAHLSKPMFRRMPPFHGLAGAAFDERRAEIAQAYCQTLLESPARLTVCGTMGWGLVVEDLRRFVHGYGRQISLENEGTALRRHLFAKIHALLKEPAFQARLAALQAQQGGESSDDADSAAFTIEDMAARLPALPSILVSPRDGFTPEVARKEDLRAQLERILVLAGRRLPTATLVELCWHTLRPGPQPARAVDAPEQLAQCAAPEISGFSRGTQGAELEAHVAALVGEIPEATRIVVARLFRAPGEPTYRELAPELGMSRSQVGNHRKSFEALFEAFVRRHDLERGEAAAVLEMTLDRFATAHFRDHEDIADLSGGRS